MSKLKQSTSFTNNLSNNRSRCPLPALDDLRATTTHTFECLYKGKRVSFDQLVIIFSLTK